MSELTATPHDAAIHSRMTLLIEANPGHRQEAYHAALQLLQTHPDKSLKAFALTVGRLHFGWLRPDGMPTTYDEQAIQNDILVRT